MLVCSINVVHETFGWFCLIVWLCKIDLHAISRSFYSPQHFVAYKTAFNIQNFKITTAFIINKVLIWFDLVFFSQSLNWSLSGPCLLHVPHETLKTLKFDHQINTRDAKYKTHLLKTVLYDMVMWLKCYCNQINGKHDKNIEYNWKQHFSPTRILNHLYQLQHQLPH